MSSGSVPASTDNGQRLRSLAIVGVLALTPLLFIGGPEWISSYLGTSVWNLGHIALFALLTVALHPWRRFKGWRLWLITTATVLFLGLLIEVIQSQLGRDADGHDLLRNLIGAWLILAWQPLLSAYQRSGPAAVTLAVASTLLLLFELGTTGVVVARQFELNRQLPQLYNFEHLDPTPYWHGHLAATRSHAWPHSQSLRIQFTTERYAGASLEHLPADWRKFSTLTLILFNPEPEPLSLTLRINDLAHERGDNAYSDRFNRRLTLAPGRNTLSLALATVAAAPTGRRMDMSQVRELKLFATDLPEPRTVYLLDLRLD